MRVPDIIKGQILQQGTGYLVRGQYVVVGCALDAFGTVRRWYWYDMYDRRIEGHGLNRAEDALAEIAEHIEAQERKR